MRRGCWDWPARHRAVAAPDRHRRHDAPSGNISEEHPADYRLYVYGSRAYPDADMADTAQARLVQRFLRKTLAEAGGVSRGHLPELRPHAWTT